MAKVAALQVLLAAAAAWPSIHGTGIGIALMRCHMFLRKTGQGLAEYALILALIAILAITALLFLSGQIQNILTQIGNAL
jgi:Flp pilus assembly pilin Flp